MLPTSIEEPREVEPFGSDVTGVTHPSISSVRAGSDGLWMAQYEEGGACGNRIVASLMYPDEADWRYNRVAARAGLTVLTDAVSVNEMRTVVHQSSSGVRYFLVVANAIVGTRQVVLVDGYRVDPSGC